MDGTGQSDSLGTPRVSLPQSQSDTMMAIEILRDALRSRLPSVIQLRTICRLANVVLHASLLHWGRSIRSHSRIAFNVIYTIAHHQLHYNPLPCLLSFHTIPSPPDRLSCAALFLAYSSVSISNYQPSATESTYGYSASSRSSRALSSTLREVPVTFKTARNPPSNLLYNLWK